MVNDHYPDSIKDRITIQSGSLYSSFVVFKKYNVSPVVINNGYDFLDNKIKVPYSIGISCNIYITDYIQKPVSVESKSDISPFIDFHKKINDIFAETYYIVTDPNYS